MDTCQQMICNILTKLEKKTKRASFDCAIYEAYQNILCHIKDVNPIKFRASGTEKGEFRENIFCTLILII